MERLTEFFIRHRRTILIVFAALVLLSLPLIGIVRVNYDLTDYLPEDSRTKLSIDKLESTFGYPSIAQVMLEDVSIPEAVEFKRAVSALDGVESVLWLDDLTDISLPEEAISPALLSAYYRGGAALFSVEFTENDYSSLTHSALAAIRALGGERLSVAGAAENARNSRGVLGPEVAKIMLIVVPFCAFILALFSHSWLEPAIYLTIIGISILLNMATNAFLPSVSFLTHSMTMVLQLAIVIDYTLFYYHRFAEERAGGADKLTAIKRASKRTVGSISASALTTIAGFAALFFMRYRIGTDLGLVLAKGIALSYICVMILMPIAIYLFEDLLMKTRHPSFIPSFAGLGKLVIKCRAVIIPLMALLMVPAFLATQNISFYYGDSAASSRMGSVASEHERIAERFGLNNPVMLLLPEGEPGCEAALAAELSADENILSVQSLATLADPSIPREMLPARLLSRFVSNGYVRVIVYINAETETAACSEALASITSAAERYYGEGWYAAGNATATEDIRSSVEYDGLRVTLFSLLFVGLIVLVSFKSALLPVLLVAVIESAILINMSITYFSGSRIIYIGYLIVSSLQLGSTIDYAILMANRYVENRALMPPKEAAVGAITTAGASVSVSAIIFAIGGLAEGLISKLSSVSAIGLLLGRGALISLVAVLLILPALLVLLDPLIKYTTLGARGAFIRRK